MRGFYRLLNVEFRLIFKPVLVLCLCTVIIPILFIRNELKLYHYYSVHERFEDIYASSGSMYIFIVLLSVFCLLVLKSFYASYWGSKRIYTVLTLPVKREAVYFSKVIAIFIGILMMLVSQLINIFWSYRLMVSWLESIDASQYVMTNGLLLAFIRSDFFRIIFPLTFEGILSSISVLTILVTGLYYGVICERSNRFWGYAIIVAAGFIAFRMVSNRLGRPFNVFYESLPNLYLHSGLLFVISGFFMWHSIKLLRKGAVT